MNLQIIKSKDGKDEYVLLPIEAYRVLKPHINKVLQEEFVPFKVTDYIANPIALARLKANLTQGELAELMNVSQAYISKLENQKTVSPKVLAKYQKVLKNANKKSK